jgi:hypothetical protein
MMYLHTLSQRYGLLLRQYHDTGDLSDAQSLELLTIGPNIGRSPLADVEAIDLAQGREPKE